VDPLSRAFRFSSGEGCEDLEEISLPFSISSLGIVAGFLARAGSRIRGTYPRIRRKRIGKRASARRCAQRADLDLDDEQSKEPGVLRLRSTAARSERAASARERRVININTGPFPFSTFFRNPKASCHSSSCLVIKREIVRRSFDGYRAVILKQ